MKAILMDILSIVFDLLDVILLFILIKLLVSAP